MDDRHIDSSTDTLELARFACKELFDESPVVFGSCRSSGTPTVTTGEGRVNFFVKS